MKRLSSKLAARSGLGCQFNEGHSAVNLATSLLSHGFKKASDKMDVSERVVIITGAGSGIGEETSYGFAKLGLSVVLVDMDADKLSKVTDKMQNLGIPSDKILTITQDMSEDSAVESIINQTISKFKRIDVLVNNAGYARSGPFEDLKPESMDKTYKVMLKAPVFLSQKALPHLKKSKGCIINVSSCMSRIPANTIMDYCAIKAGLEHFTKCLALEGAPYGIRVNSIHPGLTRTSILRASGIEDDKAFYEDAKKNIPVGRVGEVSDIASGILYLASDAASFATGSSLLLDGGISLTSPWNGLD